MHSRRGAQPPCNITDSPKKGALKGASTRNALVKELLACKELLKITINQSEPLNMCSQQILLELGRKLGSLATL